MKLYIFLLLTVLSGAFGHDSSSEEATSPAPKAKHERSDSDNVICLDIGYLNMVQTAFNNLTETKRQAIISLVEKLHPGKNFTAEVYRKIAELGGDATELTHFIRTMGTNGLVAIKQLISLENAFKGVSDIAVDGLSAANSLSTAALSGLKDWTSSAFNYVNRAVSAGTDVVGNAVNLASAQGSKYFDHALQHLITGAQEIEDSVAEIYNFLQGHAQDGAEYLNDFGRSILGYGEDSPEDSVEFNLKNRYGSYGSLRYDGAMPGGAGGYVREIVENNHRRHSDSGKESDSSETSEELLISGKSQGSRHRSRISNKESRRHRGQACKFDKTNLITRDEYNALLEKIAHLQVAGLNKPEHRSAPLALQKSQSRRFRIKGLNGHHGHFRLSGIHPVMN